MKLRRFVGVFFGIVGVVLLAAVLYVSFGDLGRRKSRIEALVTRSIGRPFAIDGPLKLRLVPTVDVSAEHVRLGNVQGGSQPQMVEIGKAVVQIGLWSLISGPPDVRLSELNDATVLLERLYGKGFAAAVGSYAFGTQILFFSAATVGTYALSFCLPQTQRSVLTLAMSTRNVGAAFAPLLSVQDIDKRAIVMVAIGLPMQIIASLLPAQSFARRAEKKAP